MKKGKIKIILEDHWHGFLKIYENKIRSNVKKEVEKAKRKNDCKACGLDIRRLVFVEIVTFWRLFCILDI